MTRHKNMQNQLCWIICLLGAVGIRLSGGVRNRDRRVYLEWRAHHFFIKLKRATDHAIEAEFLLGAVTSRFAVLRAKVVSIEQKVYRGSERVRILRRNGEARLAVKRNERHA